MKNEVSVNYAPVAVFVVATWVAGIIAAILFFVAAFMLAGIVGGALLNFAGMVHEFVGNILR